MKKAKINCEYNVESLSYKYTIKDKKTKEVIGHGYYKVDDRWKKTTGDVAKEIANNFKDWLTKKGYEI